MEEQLDWSDWSPSPPASPPSPESPLSPLSAVDDALTSFSSSSSTRQHTDSQGLTLTLSAALSAEDAAAVVAAIDGYMQAVFTYGSGWHVISRAVALDPHCVIANVLMADFLIAAEQLPLALRYLQRARQLLLLSGGSHAHGLVSRREQLYVAAWSEWVKGKRLAMATLESVIALHPNDLFAVKKAQLIAFLQGDFPLMLRLVRQPAVVAACSARPFYHGMLAFALEENGEVQEAEAAARRGIAISADDVWSYHAVAHCLLHDGRLQEGIDWMEGNAARWQRCMSFMYTHSWFHAALFYLEAGRMDSVRHCYEQHVWKLSGAAQEQREDGDDCGLPAHGSSDSPASSSPAAVIAASTAGHLPSLPMSPRSPSAFSPFLHSDKSKLEDQLNALILLWKWELRLARETAAAEQPSAAAAASASVACSASPSCPPLSPLSHPSFTPYYADLLRHISWPPANCLGLYGLLLIHAAARAGEAELAASLLRQISEKVAAMPDAAGSRRRAKHQAIYLPVAKAILLTYTQTLPAQRGADKAYDVVSPVMTAYHNYMHRHQRRHKQQQQQQQAAAVSSSSSSSSVSSPASWSARSFPFSGRHLLQVIVGSGEQRSVLTDYWLLLLLATGRYAECEREAQRWLRDRQAEGRAYWQSVIDLCRRRRAAAEDEANAASA